MRCAAILPEKEHFYIHGERGKNIYQIEGGGIIPASRGEEKRLILKKGCNNMIFPEPQSGGENAQGREKLFLSALSPRLEVQHLLLQIQ